VILSTEKRKIVVMPQYLSITTPCMDLVCTGNGKLRWTKYVLEMEIVCTLFFLRVLRAEFKEEKN
jgi:hypothetical protein